MFFFHLNFISKIKTQSLCFWTFSFLRHSSQVLLHFVLSPKILLDQFLFLTFFKTQTQLCLFCRLFFVDRMLFVRTCLFFVDFCFALLSLGFAFNFRLAFGFLFFFVLHLLAFSKTFLIRLLFFRSLCFSMRAVWFDFTFNKMANQKRNFLFCQTNRNSRSHIYSQLLFLGTCLQMITSQASAYYCNHDFCSATEQYCCGENICCFITDPYRAYYLWVVFFFFSLTLSAWLLWHCVIRYAFSLFFSLSSFFLTSF